MDCGITALGWCNSHWWKKLGTMRNFLTVLVMVGIALGTTEQFLSISIQQAAAELDYDPRIVSESNTILNVKLIPITHANESTDWLLVTNGVAQGLFSILIAYSGNRIHKISWISAIIILQSVCCFLVVIPTITHK